MTEPRPLVLLDEEVDAGAMVAAVDTLARWPRLALDTESDSFHRYSERVCLIQISTPEEDLIFDPIAHGMPRDLRAVLAAPDRTWILHGGDYDVLSLRREFDLMLGGLFDTMVAARFLGKKALGLQAVLKEELGVDVSKAEQRSDWGRRPLTEAQIGYARQDTQHLLPLADRLIEALKARGRLAWVQEECALLRVRVPVVRPFDEHGWLKIRGARSLPELGQRVLRGGYLWRDQVARRANKAPFRVVGNEVLFAVAEEVIEHGPAVLLDLARRRGISKGLDVRSLSEALRAAIADPGPIMPRRVIEARPPPLDLDARARLDKLRAARQRWAEELELEAGVVMPSALLEALAKDPPQDPDALLALPGMTAWRAEALGAQVLDILHQGG